MPTPTPLSRARRRARTCSCAAALAVVAFASAAGAQPRVVPPRVPPPPPIPASLLDVAPVVAPHPIAVPTYDGSGQAVHPDVVQVPGGWRGWAFWMAFTPYPGGRPQLENPSLLVSQDGEHWTPPTGLANPVVLRPDAPRVYNSDPDLSYDALTDRLRLVYREVIPPYAVLLVRESSDGVHWSAPRTLFRVREGRAISPTLVATSGRPSQLWVVDAYADGCQTRVASVRRLVGAAHDALPTLPDGSDVAGRIVSLAQPGYVIWHLDVLHVAMTGEYWAVYAAYPVGAHCDASDLFVARSMDGRVWESAARPLLGRGRLPWASASLYRGTLWYDATQDVMHVLFSGRTAANVWGLGATAYRLPDLRRALTGDAVSLHRVEPPAKLLTHASGHG